MEDEAALKWMSSMKAFCQELQHFINHQVPEDAIINEFGMASQCPYLLSAPSQQYSVLASISENTKFVYMEGIPRIKNPSVQEAANELCGIASQTYKIVTQHPTFNIFQCNPETRISAFFERALFMCLALGTEKACCCLQNSP